MSTKVLRRIRLGLWAVLTWWRSHLVLTAVALVLAYMIGVQGALWTSGDTWAESFVEYLDEALRLGWREVFAASWVGYLTIIPSFLSKAYVAAGLSLGMIDLFYRAVVVAFVVGCAAFIAAPYNRAIIRSDILRTLLALGLVVLLHDVAVVSFINCWYVGFVPLALLCLNPQRLSVPAQVGAVAIGVLLVLSKPSLVLLPFVLYRAWKTKEYVSGALLAVAIVVQTYFLFYGGKAAEHSGPDVSLLDTLHALAMGAAGIVFKLVHVVPEHSTLAMLTGVIVLIGLAVWLWRAQGIWVASLIVFGFAVSLYGYISPPGEYALQLLNTVKDMYAYEFKPQREFMIIGFLLLWLFLLAPSAIAGMRHMLSQRLQWLPLALCVSLLLGLGMRAYQPADAGLLTDINPFRTSLAARQPVCVPLPVPAPGWRLDTNWVFQEGGGCLVGNTEQVVQRATFDQVVGPLSTEVTIVAPPDHSLKAVLLMVKAPYGTKTQLTLRNARTGRPYYATTHPTHDGYSTVTFNTAGIAPVDTYHFVLSGDNTDTTIGRFTPSGEVALYPYFMGGEAARK